MVEQPNTPIEAIDDTVTLLYEAVLDIDTLIQQSPATSRVKDEDHPICDLKALIVRISHKLRKSFSHITKSTNQADV